MIQFAVVAVIPDGPAEFFNEPYKGRMYVQAYQPTAQDAFDNARHLSDLFPDTRFGFAQVDAAIPLPQVGHSLPFASMIKAEVQILEPKDLQMDANLG